MFSLFLFVLSLEFKARLAYRYEFNNRNVVVSPTGLAVTFNSCTMNGGTPVYYVDNTDGIIRGGNMPNVTINN